MRNTGLNNVTVIPFKGGACLHPSRWIGANGSAPPHPTPARPQVRMGASGSAPQSPTTGEDGAIESSRQSLATDDSAASHRALERQRLEMFATTVREHTRCSRVLCVRQWESEIICGNGRDFQVPQVLGSQCEGSLAFLGR